MPDISTRDHLIEMGFKYMQQSSYSATGLSEVLALAGLSKGSFYHYFSSKEDFGVAILQRYRLLAGYRFADFAAGAAR